MHARVKGREDERVRAVISFRVFCLDQGLDLESLLSIRYFAVEEAIVGEDWMEEEIWRER
jgi:hypothetical protein